MKSSSVAKFHIMNFNYKINIKLIFKFKIKNFLLKMFETSIDNL